MKYLKALGPCVLLVLAGCQATKYEAIPTQYESVNQPSAVSGSGIESQDILSMTDQMARDMLSSPVLSARDIPPRIILDSEYFSNESSTRINKNMITDRLRVSLNRAASGRMFFINRENLQMINSERSLKREGSVDTATIGSSEKLAGADFRLVGRISSLDAVDTTTSAQSRYHQIMFEMVDLEQGFTVWSGLYEFKKSSQDDIIYR